MHNNTARTFLVAILAAFALIAFATGCASNPLIEHSQTHLKAKVDPDGTINVDYRSSKNQDVVWTDPATGRELKITSRQDENLVSTAGAVQAQANAENSRTTGKLADLARELITISDDSP